MVTQEVLLEKAKNIKMVLMDVDGVMTDGCILLGDDGVELKRFNIYDGQGIYLLHQVKIKVGIITGRESEALRIRANNLNISEVHQGIRQKFACYKKIIEQSGFKDSEVAYIGDDLIDLSVLRVVGLSVGVDNAVKEVKDSVDYVTAKKGGQGAVRELVDLILKAKGYDLAKDFWQE